jgi:hypothetical protein
MKFGKFAAAVAVSLAVGLPAGAQDKTPFCCTGPIREADDGCYPLYCAMVSGLSSALACSGKVW